MMAYLLICLAISLLTLHYYVYTGFHSVSHRLLPLALGMVCLYNFYMVIDYATGYTEVILVLKRLLMIQLLYLVFYYERDFMRHMTKLWFIILSFTTLIIADVVIVVMYMYGGNYASITTGVINVLILLIIIGSIYDYRREHYTQTEYMTYGVLNLAIFVPTVTMLVIAFTGMRDVVLLPAAFSVSSMLIMYLLETNNLEEPRYRLESIYFMNSDIVAVIYDARYNFLEANTKAQNEFPELVEKYRNVTIKSWVDNNNVNCEKEYRGRYYRISVSAVTQDGVIMGYILTSVDITEEKKKVSQMESLKEAAENETRIKGEFLANMSHDLRSPLHAIIGGSDILLSKNDMLLKNRNMVCQIREAGIQLLDMVNDILDFSKLDKGRLDLEHSEFDMDGLFTNQAHNCVVILKSTPVKFYMNIHDRHPRTLIGDELRVREIVQNLLSNAIKFTKEGEIRLDVYCAYLSPEKVRLTILVKDTGIGLKEEYKDSIFENYVSYGTDGTYEGTGLGLTIVKQLCEKMGGSVSAESDGETGTLMTAVIYLDAVADNVRAPISMDSDSMAALPSNFEIARPSWGYPEARVLMADDMSVNLKIFKEMVRPWQFKLDMVSSGKEAVQAVENQKYDLIILDQMMPGMTGKEAAIEIQKICDTPLVMLTADITDEMKLASRKCGFTEFLAKPIEQERLKRVIEKLLPEKYRKPVQGIYIDKSLKPDREEKLEAYYTSLKSYQNEVSDIRDQLLDYYNHDLEKFRIKVHGIKGISRQLGKNRIGTHAEIIEMAAKCHNTQFLDDHLAGFIEDIDVALEMTALEIESVKEKLDKGKTRALRIKMTDEYVNELFDKVKEGFEHYNVTMIEAAMEELSKCYLTKEQSQLAERLQEAFDEFEYEKGLALFDTEVCR